jgi:two-component system LytT family response regulator
VIRVLVADDEPLARDGLIDFLAGEPDMRVVGEARDGPDTVEAIGRLRPDLVLLDIQMPGLSGVEVLASLPDEPPAVVFVTAYDRYAVAAFEVHAIDYLLKPVERERFRRAMAQVRRQLAAGGGLTDRAVAALGSLDGGGARRTRFVVKAAGKIRLIKAAEVRYIEAAGNYARLHTKEGRHSIRETMQSLEAQLDPSTFLRIHRSYFVNLDEVREIQHWVKGDLVAVLKGGGTLPLSRAYRSHLETRLGQVR